MPAHIRKDRDYFDSYRPLRLKAILLETPKSVHCYGTVNHPGVRNVNSNRTTWFLPLMFVLTNLTSFPDALARKMDTGEMSRSLLSGVPEGLKFHGPRTS